MAVCTFVVRATVPPERDAEFNRWYSGEHAPDVLRFQGAVSARRYRVLGGEGRYQYVALYEFESRESLDRFLGSDHLRRLVAEYDAHFPESERERATWEQIWP